MNYIDSVAQEISKVVEGPVDYAIPSNWNFPLYRIYAVLLLAKGEGVTAEDVHNAWAAWTSEDRPEHHSLVPFSQLTEEVQHLDDPYVEAIHKVAQKVGVV